MTQRVQMRLFESTDVMDAKRTSFLESVSGLTSDKVDREAGVIRHVKILGKESKNNRTYTENARKQAVQLYEGCSVRFDHKPGELNRPFVDDIGVLTGIYEKDEAVYAKEFQVIKSHPFADLVFETAERFPHKGGFSHDADGLVEMRSDGGMDVVELYEVKSVDLVANPATNKSLFESVETPEKKEQRKMRKLTIREAIQKAPKSTPGRKRLQEMADGDEDVLEMEMEVADEATPVMEMDSSLLAMLQAILGNGEMDPDSKINAILEMLGKLQGATPATEEEIIDPAAEEASPEPEKLPEEQGTDELTKMTEAVAKMIAPVVASQKNLQEQVSQFLNADKEKKRLSVIEQELRDAGVKVTEATLEIAKGLGDKARDAYIQQLRESQESSVFIAPRSSGASDSNEYGVDAMAKRLLESVKS
ncbi:hypothetical protein KOR42_22810 [Thalassoglobus neptunius]|uniref:Uncharacterized protein n=1 Tax=Thalassoglobus neptunius TaxID=1938619 RepID=A0A5C5X7K6_9PLAN|nr:hypothetical protein [Thalassoglobus neptunius]TWT58894.1 hypothetical protein KOR42_22810 [Thalassoglobus neptunius]